MKVNVEYFAQVKKTIGKARDSIAVDHSLALEDLLGLLYDRNGAEFRSIVFDDQRKVRPSIMISVNNEQIHAGTVLGLNDGDTISMLSPMSGG